MSIFFYAQVVNLKFDLYTGQVRIMASKLEMYVNILNVLAQRGPQDASHFKLDQNISITSLKAHLKFLIKQGLIEEQTVGKNRMVYTNTARGTSVIKFFTQLDKTLTTLDEDCNISKSHN